MCKVYTGYCGTSEIEHGLCACTVDNPRALARGLSTVQALKPCSISHLYAINYYHFYYFHFALFQSISLEQKDSMEARNTPNERK